MNEREHELPFRDFRRFLSGQYLLLTYSIGSHGINTDARILIHSWTPPLVHVVAYLGLALSNAVSGGARTVEHSSVTLSSTQYKYICPTHLLCHATLLWCFTLQRKLLSSASPRSYRENGPNPFVVDLRSTLCINLPNTRQSRTLGEMLRTRVLSSSAMWS